MIVNIVCYPSKAEELQLNDSSHVENIFDEIVHRHVDKSCVFVLCNGRKVTEDTPLENGKTYHVVPRLLGGKGGFGSMLRAIGAQIEKTTSREACRDLSGRRMRDINNEKKLKEWLAKEADREHDREQRRQERLARHTHNQHKFDDPAYHEQQAKVQEDLEDALNKGLKRTHNKEETAGPSTSKKVKPAVSYKKTKAEWFGVDVDSDELDSASDNEACPGGLDSSEAENTSRPAQAGIQTSSDTDDNSRSCDSGSSSTSINSAVKEEPEDEKNNECSGAAASNVHMPTQNMKKMTEDGKTGKGKTGQCSLLSALPPPSHEIDLKPADNIPSDTPVDLDCFNSSKELAALGLERLKNALIVRGLKCGGTLEERAQRLFSVKGLEPDQINPLLLAKSKGKGKKG